MYTILLTDDEKIVIEALRLILTKNFPEEICVETALSGSKALEIVKTKSIDIAFMDIHMSGLNGLETISLIKKINPNIVIIILSAYDQFQYAQEALNLGAFKYLTKPVNRELIVQTVRSVITLIESRHKNMADSIELHEKLNLVSTMVESDFIYSCMFNSRSMDFSEYLSYFGIENLPYYMCTIELPDLSKNYRQQAYQKVRDVLTSKCRCIIGSLVENKVVAFFPIYKEENEVQMEENQRELMEKIYLLLVTSISSSVRLGVSEIFFDIEESQTAYSNSVSALTKTSDSGGLIFFKNLGLKLALDSSDFKKLSKFLVARVCAGDFASVNSMCVDYINALFSSYDDLDKIRNNVFETIINIRNAVFEVDASYKNEAFDSIFLHLSKMKEKNEFEAFLAELSIQCSNAIVFAKSESENPVIKKACKYIEEHLCEDFGLESLAEELNVSPYYLSRLFKDEKGENLINYVTSLRMDTAKRLLNDRSLIIKEISAKVGYNDQNYFAKLFRHKFGLSPSEYREKLSSERGKN